MRSNWQQVSSRQSAAFVLFVNLSQARDAKVFCTNVSLISKEFERWLSDGDVSIWIQSEFYQYWCVGCLLVSMVYFLSGMIG